MRALVSLRILVALISSWFAVPSLVHADHVDVAPMPQEIIDAVVNRPEGEKVELMFQADQLMRQIHEQMTSHLSGTALASSLTLEGAQGELRAHRLAIARLIGDLRGRGLSTTGRRALAVEFMELDRLISVALEAQTQSDFRRRLSVVADRLQLYIRANDAIDADDPGHVTPTISGGHRFKVIRDRSAPPPPSARHDGELPGGTLLAALGMDGLALSAPPTPAQAQRCTYSAADLATEQAEVKLDGNPELRALAAELQYNPVRIFEYVANRVEFNPDYAGSLKGASLTLKSSNGNALDQASLLVALLRASNIPSRYLGGVIAVSDPQPMGKDGRINRWLGVGDYPAAMEVLMRAGHGNVLPITNAEGRTIGVSFGHFWVEACLPYTAYRGQRINDTGHRWIQLDPSFQDARYREGLAHEVQFNLDDYLSKRRNGPDSLPHEYYSEQIEAAIRAASELNSIDRVARRRTDRPLKYDILPATLPYRVIRYETMDEVNARSYSAVIPDRERYRVKIRVRRPAPQDGVWLEIERPLPELLAKRLTVGFKGIDATHQSRIDSWRNASSLDSPEPSCSSPLTYVTPVLRADGVEIASGSAVAPNVSFCVKNARLDLTVSLTDRVCERGDGVIFEDGCISEARFQNIDVGNLYALVVSGHQGSDQLIQERISTLLKNVKAAGTEPNGTSHVDGVEGEFLHLVGLKFGRYMADGVGRVARLSGAVPRVGVSLGVTTARSKVGMLMDQPFAIHRKGFLIDVPGGRAAILDFETGEFDAEKFFIAGRMMSAYESYVWQENAKLDAVSTIRGLQFANESKGTAADNSLLRLTKANWAVEKVKLKFNADRIEILRKQVFENDAVVYTPRNVIVYDPTWTGVVYAAESATKVSALYAIEQGASGGYAMNNRVSYNFNSYLNTGYSYLNTVATPSYTSTFVQPSVPVSVNSHVNLGNSAGTTYSGDPVNMVTGNMYHNETDIDLPLKGQLRMVFQRAYNSGRAGTDGPLGFGWTHSFDHSLTFSDDDFDGTTSASDTNGITSGVVWTDGTAAEKHIVVTAGASVTGVAVTTSSFKAPPGYHFSVARNVDGSYSITERDGLRYTFQSVAGKVGERARLTEIADRHGHRLALTYEAASSSQRLVSVSDGTRTLVFGYPNSTALRIQSVTDWTGRKLQFEHDAAGDLRKAWRPGEPPSGPPGMTYDYYVAADGPYSAHRMKRFASVSGEYMDFEYYSNGRTLRHRNARGDTISFTYNEFRRESVQVNERGHERRFFFDKNGMLIKQVEENGANREFVYGAADGPDRFNLMASIDPRGNRTEYEYDTAGNLRLTRHPSSRTTERSHFNAYGQPGKIKDVRGLYTLFRYDAKGHLLDTVRLKAGVGAAIDPAVQVPAADDIVAWMRNGWDIPSGRMLHTTRVRNFATGEGPSVEYGYDALGYHVNRLIRRGDLNSDGAIVESEVDSADLTIDTLGRVTGGVDEKWERYTTDYDDHGRIRAHVDATGSRADFRYDASGKPVGEALSVTQGGVLRQLRSVAHEYDLAGRKIRTTTTGGAAVQFEYDAAGNLVRQTDPDGRTMVWHYDEMNRVTAVEDAEGNQVVSDLDVDGRPLTVTDANGLTTRYEYWGSARDGRLRRVEAQRAAGFAGGRAVEYDYDEAGNAVLVRQIGADGGERTTLTRFDELNRPVRIAGPAVNDPVHGMIRPVRLNRYDTLGRLTEVRAGRTDASGENPAADVMTLQARYAWDDFGRLLREEDGAGRPWTYTYDRASNVLTRADPRGKVTTFEWDSGGRLRSRSNETGTTTWERDGLGAPLKVSGTNPAYRHEYSYDAFHRVVSIRDSRGGKRIDYEYTRGGLLTAMRDSEGAETNYQYDATGRLIGVWAPNYDYFGFGYDRGGRLTEKWSPDGVTSRWQYGDDGSLQQIEHVAGGAVRARHEYAYDQWGNRREVAETLAGTTVRYTHEYDALDRLTHSTLAQGSPEVSSDLGRWQYDILGNRTRQTLADGRSLRYVYDEVGGQPQQAGAQQLRRIDLYSSAGALLGTDATLQWDAAGNLTGKSGAGYSQVFAWDADNRLRQSLTQVSNGSSTSTYDERYGYDAQGRRLVRQMLAGGMLYVSQYLYSGEDIVKEYGASWVLPVAAYVHGAGTDEALLVQSGAGTRYYHADGLGTPGLLTDEAGATYAWRRNDAWGRALGGAGTMPLYGYAGRELDLSSGLVYMRARYYDAALGRFISRDPIGLSGGLNVYAYVGNNPVNYVDPDGLFAKSVGNTLQGWGDTASRYFDSASLGLGGTRQNGATVTWRPSPYRQDAGVSAQTAIGLASAIPVVGVPFALVGAAMDIEQGNYGSAALNLAGAIPGVGMLRGVGRTADVLLDASKGAHSLGSALNRTLSFSERQLQKKFDSHATDFGITRSWGRGAAEEYQAALNAHVADPGTRAIFGTYRGTQDVTHFFNPQTGLNVMRDADGAFLSGWRLSTDQAKNLLLHGNVQ